MSPILVSLPNLLATEALAQKCAQLLHRGDVLALHGDLGTGKTSFARALLRALGITGDVPSPTFTLVQHYETASFPVAHFDLYRLKHAAELDELGWDDALADGVVVVEWPEHAGDRLPAASLNLYFSVDGEARQCVISGGDDWAARLTGLSI